MIVVDHPVDLWDWVPPEAPFLRAITTNGTLRKNGQLVMGRGTAQQAASRYPDLPRRVGDHVAKNGNSVLVCPDLGLMTFPTKQDWRDRSDLTLIQQSAQQLRAVLESPGCPWRSVVLPKPGCGFGWTSWDKVQPVLEPLLAGLPVYVIGR